MLKKNEKLEGCLYYAINQLSRTMTRIAEESFKTTGLSPTYAFLLSIVNEYDGITQKDIGEILDVAPSTVTRFIDKLEYKGYLERIVEGKNSYIHATEKGKFIQKDIDLAWENLHDLHEKHLGIEGYEKAHQTLNEIYTRLKGF